MFGFLSLLDLFCASVAIAIVNLFLSLGDVFCRVQVLTGFLNVWISALSGLVLCVGGYSYCKHVFAPGSIFCRVQVLTGFLNAWISGSSGFVLFVGGHSHRKSFLSPISVFCCVQVLTGFLNVRIFVFSGYILCVGGHSYRKSFVFLRFCFLSCLGAHRFLKCSDFSVVWIYFARPYPS